MSPVKVVAGTRFPRQGGLAKLRLVLSTHKPSFAGVADERFGVDRAREMNVQVGAFGKIVEESSECLGALVQVGFVDEGCARLGLCGYPLWCGLLAATGKCRQGNACSNLQETRSDIAPHDCSPV